MISSSPIRLMLIATLALPSPSWGAYEFSSYEFARNPARVSSQMRVSMRGRAALRSFRFVGRVGGVNFESVVDLSAYDIDLEYDNSRPDGERGTVDIDGQKFTLPLYDWELAPIVNYADSEYTAVVSIFGEGPDREDYYYIDYHPALEDTHLGMRLLQADIMLMDPVTFSEAPSESGKKVYMAGEAHEGAEEDRFLSALLVQSMLVDAQYQAWVLTDNETRPSLRFEEDVVGVYMNPYYYFWTSDNTERERLFAEYDELFKNYEPLAQEYDQTFEVYRGAPGGSPLERNALNRIEELQLILEPMVNRIREVEARIENHEPEIVEVDELTSLVRSNYRVLHDLAPYVYSAVDKTARYAALFRGAKQANSADWSAFLEQVADGVNLPFSETPNQFRRP